MSIFKRKVKEITEFENSLVNTKPDTEEHTEQKEWAISKIINGKLYDTSKAQEICSVVVPVDEIPDYNFPFFCLGGQEVTIYKGRTEYFITYYCCLNQVSEEWVKKCLGEQNMDKYIELFGEPEMA